jgi:hypothetical protein
VEHDWKNRETNGGLSEFRLQFPKATDGDNANDYQCMYGNNSTYKPTLTVEYEAP